jgi:hypothetical protein
MPDRLTLWIAVATSYAVFIEWKKQGWQKVGSIPDTYFVALGAAGPLVSLYEVSYYPNIELNLVWGGWGFLLWMMLTIISFILHITPRIIRKLKEDSANDITK